MNRPGRIRRAVRKFIRAAAEGVMVYGGRDMYLASERSRAPYREYDFGRGVLALSGWDGPPPGHPEQLCADVPLTVQEHLLMRDLEHVSWLPPKERW